MPESDAAARIDGLLESLEAVSDPVGRARLLVEIGVRLRDELGDRAQAIDALLEALTCDPLHPTGPAESAYGWNGQPPHRPCSRTVAPRLDSMT